MAIIQLMSAMTDAEKRESTNSNFNYHESAITSLESELELQNQNIDRKISDGAGSSNTIIKYGTIYVAAANTFQSFNYNIPFPTALKAITLTPIGNNVNFSVGGDYTRSTFSVIASTTAYMFYIAIGN